MFYIVLVRLISNFDSAMEALQYLIDRANIGTCHGVEQDDHLNNFPLYSISEFVPFLTVITTCYDRERTERNRQ